ncbi:MAG: hypothetical protein M3Y57_02600 [Acidobacteriota bacterium]|nr:hypothetical protein [Acidobacteriota bacterium]
MKKPLPVGLVVEGNSTSSLILRLPSLAEELGPVKSKGFRVARRITNFLRSGYPVATYEELQETRLILVRVPDAVAPRVVEEICASELDFGAMCFALCETWLTSEVLEPLRKRGACTGTLISGPNPQRAWFLAEGQSMFVRQLRRLIERNEARVLEIGFGKKELYFAAELLATAIPIPLFTAAQQALREAGISANHVHALLEDMAAKMFKDFLNGSRVAWGGPLTTSLPETAEGNFRSLPGHSLKLARYIEEQLSLARRAVQERDK